MQKNCTQLCACAGTAATLYEFHRKGASALSKAAAPRGGLNAVQIRAL